MAKYDILEKVLNMSMLLRRSIFYYDNSNRKINKEKITKPDMKMTFKVPGNPVVYELTTADEIKRYLS